MAKKKVTKKTRAAPRRKTPATKKKSKPKKTAKKAATTSKKPAARKKAPAAKAASRTTTKTKKKTATKAAATTRKTTSTRRRAGSAKGKKAGDSAKMANLPAPDANGYVIINGRRVRMMSASTSTRPTTSKKVWARAQVAIAPEPSGRDEKPIKTRLKKKELERFWELLLRQRGELVGDLSAMEEQALQATGGNFSHMPIHMADIGTDTYDQDFMLGLAETERQRLREIDDALKRIQDRTYGVCQMTGRPIPKARLNAKPWARYTIEAALEIERGIGK